jgi:hypothetical protein
MTPVTAAEKAGPSITAYRTARSTISGAPLSAEDLRKVAAPYFKVGLDRSEQVYGNKH